MPRPTIDYLNARRAILPASGGAWQDWSAKSAPIDEIDPIDRTEQECDSAWRMLDIRTEAMWQQIFERFGIVRAEHVDEIPF